MSGSADWGSLATLEAWTPIRVDGAVRGAAVVWRDMTALDAEIRRITAATSLIIAIAAALLWLVLHGVYVRSSQQIRERSSALADALAEVEVTYDRTLHALSNALDVRDTETEGHSRRVVEILKQPQYQPFPVEDQIVIIWAVGGGKLDDIPTQDCRRFEAELREYLRSRHPGLLDAIRDTGTLEDGREEALSEAVDAFRLTFRPSEAVEEEEHVTLEALDTLRDLPPVLFDLAFVDADCTADPHWLESIAERSVRLMTPSGAIDLVNERLASDGLPTTILKSIEMNLNPHGEGDMDPRALARLDLVLGSFHSALRKKEDQTDRYISALRNPDIHVLGHPRGDGRRDRPIEQPLSGIVEVDETFIGNDRSIKPRGEKKGRGFAHKHKVLALVDRKAGTARTMVVDNLQAKTLTPILTANIAREARVMTDEAAYYSKLGDSFADHEYVNHKAEEWARGEVHTNTLEGFFSIFKRGMRGVYQHCAKKHLHRYAAEFEFRYNHRVGNGCDDQMRAERALAGIKGKRLTYRQSPR